MNKNNPKKISNIFNKIKGFLIHPWKAKYWIKEVGIGIRRYALRKSAAKKIILLCCLFLGVLFFIAIFFHNLGRFVVTVDPSLEKEGISISSDIKFSSPKVRLFSSALEECNNININSIPVNVDQEYEGSHNGKNYVAYTFYLRNEGEKPVDYEYSLNIGGVTKNVDEAAWVMLYYNGVPRIFAKTGADGNPECQYSYNEYNIAPYLDAENGQISSITGTNLGYLSKEDIANLQIIDVNGLLELMALPFASDKVVSSEEIIGLEPGQMDKYTIVVWLEGEDPECVDEIKGGYIELNMDFDVTSNEEAATME